MKLTRSLILAVMLAACGQPVPECPNTGCTEGYARCAAGAVFYEDLLSCRDSMNACLGRPNPPQDRCFGELGACLQADTSDSYRRTCLQAEADCLNAECDP